MLTPSKQPPLTVELVPKSCWYSNVRSNVSKKSWDTLRRACYQKANYRCEICNGTGKKWPVEAHEVWQYDDQNLVQKLIRLIALCPACHEVKHFGRAAAQGRVSNAFAHLSKINKWDIIQSSEYIQNQFKIWETRSNQQWDLDISWLDAQPFKQITQKDLAETCLSLIINNSSLARPIFIQDLHSKEDVSIMIDYPLCYAWIDEQENFIVSINGNGVACVLEHFMDFRHPLFQSVRDEVRSALQKISSNALTTIMEKLDIAADEACLAIVNLKDIKNKTFSIKNNKIKVFDTNPRS